MSNLLNDNRVEESEPPRILYKYRTWGNPEHRRVLEHNEIYYASPEDFDEITECNIESDYDAVSEEMLQEVCLQKAELELKMGEILTSQVKKRALFLYKNNKFHDLEHRIKHEAENRERVNKDISIFSVSETALNERLWEVFANHKTGFCVGIDFTEIYKDDEIFGSCGEVDYYDVSNPPKIVPLSLTQEERLVKMRTLIYSLPDKFKEEAEFRFAKMYIKNRRVKIKSDWIKEVILGSEISSSDEKEIVELVKKKHSVAVLKKLFIEPTFNIMSIVNYSI